MISMFWLGRRKKRIDDQYVQERTEKEKGLMISMFTVGQRRRKD